MVWLALLLTVPSHAWAQGYRGSVTVSGQWLEIRGLQRDSLPESAVSGSGTRRQLDDGTFVTCIPNGSCQWYGSGPEEAVSLVTQDVEVATWPGITGLSGYVHLRGRYGSGNFWPRTDQEMDAIAAYARYDRGDFRVLAGRQFRTNGLGYYNFDGGAVLWRGFDRLRVELYGGWSLARNLNAPRTGNLLEDADEFAPGDRGLLLGLEVLGRLGEATSGKFTYQREIRSDELAFYSERIAGDLRTQMERISVDLSADYDLAFEEFNEASIRVAAPVVYGFEVATMVRRYTPFFELWTIWGAFSPVGYDEGRLTVGWTAPSADLRLEGGGAYRAYEEADAGADFIPFKEDGWRAFGRARWQPSPWFVDLSYRADRGTGAARYGGDLAVGREFGEGTYLAIRGTSSQNFSEFRLGDRLTSGWGVDGAIRWRDLSVIGGWGLYWISTNGQPRVEDWTQQRGHLGVTYRFGTEPVVGEATYP
jgi:hypothetical protein